MLVADRQTPLAPARRISTRFLRSELTLIFGRPRNWVGMAILAVFPIIIAVATKVSPPGASAEDPGFFGSIVSNGFFVALAALTVEIALFLPLAVAAISADAIASEANTGTLRYLLTVPVGRTRLILVKFTSILIFAFAATLLVAGVGLLAGLILFGGGKVTLLSGAQVPLINGVLRLLLVCAYLTICLTALGTVGLFISTLTEQPIAATIAVMILTIASAIMDNIPQLSWVHEYLISHHWTAFAAFLRDPIDWGAVGPGLLSALIYTAVFGTAAWARLSNRDITS